jgi:hypothetical protein
MALTFVRFSIIRDYYFAKPCSVLRVFSRALVHFTAAVLVSLRAFTEGFLSVLEVPVLVHSPGDTLELRDDELA